MFKLAGNSCVVNGIATLDCIPVIFQNLIFWALTLAGVVALFLIILGGIKFITSGGDHKQTDSAKKTITWALIGLVVILSSFAILNIIADITGVKCITRFGFNSCGSIDSAPAKSTPQSNGNF